MLTIVNRPVQRMIVQGQATAAVQSKPRVQTLRVVQTVSPVPVSGASAVWGALTGQISDQSDLAVELSSKVDGSQVIDGGNF